VPLNLRPRVFTEKLEAVSPLDDVPISPPSPDFYDEMPLMGQLPVEAQTEAEVYTSVTVRLPQSVYDEYRRVATAQGQEIEDVISHRLAQCRSHNALKGLWFGDSDRSALEDTLQKRPLDAPAKVLAALNSGGSFKLETTDGEPITISLTPAQRKVLKLSMYGGRTPKKYLEDLLRREFRV
jgi:hypothetical protein